MTMYDKANDLIGKPYDAYKSHCWDLVEHLQPLAPKIKTTAENLTKTVKTFNEETEANAQSVFEVKENDLQDGDVVLLGNSTTLHHAGIFLNNGVIHASLEGVVFERYAIIKQKYTLQKGLRCKLL